MANPYVYDGPIERRECFFNRQSELTRISSRVAASRPQSVSVVGSGRTGKSSLVNYLLDPATQAEVLDDPARYFLLRVRLSCDPPQTPPAFFTRLSRALQYLGEPPIEPTYDGFSGLVRATMQAGRRLVLFLDDFDQVTQRDGFALEFYSFMRSVANSHDVAYLTTSWAPLQQLCHTQDIEESPFFNIFTTVNLDPFTDEAARRLVLEPARAAGASLEAQLEDVLTLAGGSPYLLQLAASLAFDALGSGGLDRRQLTAGMLDRSRAFLNWWWENLSDAQRAVLRAVADGKPVERRHEYAAESMAGQGILRPEEKGYRFRAAVVGEYVRTSQKGGLLKRLFG
ncbi:MAG: AAA-like domain-containing protein [Gemmatimonadota bacterium]